MNTRLLLPLLFLSFYVQGQVTLDADGPAGVPTYDLITNVLAPGYNPVEVPDCGHNMTSPNPFGDHITEIFDADLGDNAFQFFIHVNEDDDRCGSTDRQRNEIKSYDQSPANLLGVVGETVEYRWKFKLPTGFQASSSFTHLHQLKSVNDPYDNMPMITFTARKGTPDKLELRYAEFGSQSTIYSADLDPFKGVWVEAVETIAYSNAGSYAIDIKRVSDGVSLFQHSDNNINVWRCGADFIRPKWGIYRSLNVPADLRDEEVRYANFSITETTIAGVGVTGVTLAPATATMDIGDTQQLTSTISPANTTDQCVTYSSSDPSVATVSADGLVSGLGAGTATITITTTDGSFTGTSVITINAASTNDCPLLVDVKAMLQGAYDGGTTQMATDLATGNLVPTTEPYTGTSYTHVGGGGEVTTTAIITANDIVDWVVIELRDKMNSASVVATRAALLRKDGQAVDVDGVSSVAFENVAADDYYIAVRHRNHLGIMTNATVPLIASSVPTIVNVVNADFEAGTSSWTNGSLGGTIQTSSSPVYEGLVAGKLPADGTRIAYQLVTVTPDTNYDLSFWYTIKTTPVGASFTVHILDSHVTIPGDVAAATITSSTYTDQSSSNTYVQETISFNSGTSSQIAIYMTNTVADARFDALSLIGEGADCGAVVDCTIPLSEPGFEDNTDNAGCGTQQNGTDCWENNDLRIGGVNNGIQITTSPVHSGSQAGKLPSDGSRIAYQAVSVDANTNYTLTFWYTMKNAAGSLNVDILDMHVTDNADIPGAIITGGAYTYAASNQSQNDYEETSVSFNSGTSTTIAIYISNSGVECRFDDFSLTRTDCGGSSPTCLDGIQNQGETGIDCGGPCAACPATCSDGIMNGDETDIDCGGATCPACPTCSDSIQNGDETGVDCGGSCPTACANLCPTADYPADNLGTNWKLNGYSGTLNVGTTNNGLTYLDNVPGFATHENDNWFYLDDDCWTYFKTYPGNPTSSGSGNPRTELREMIADGSTEISWDGTTATEHSMKWRVKVDQLSQSGKLCFGQIHAGSGSSFDDVIRVQCQGSANQTSGSVTWRILGYVAETLLGSGQSVGSFNLGDELYLELTMQNSIVTLYQLDNVTGIRMAPAIFTSGAVASTGNYFKAGCYLQSSQGQTASGVTDFGLVGINEISVSH